jgi:hypothetical protein
MEENLCLASNLVICEAQSDVISLNQNGAKRHAPPSPLG